MDGGLPIAANESASGSSIGARPQPPLEHEHGHEHEYEKHSNGSATMGDKDQVPAQVDKHPVDAASASKADAADAELQRRKATLLQQVEDALAKAGIQAAFSCTRKEAPAAAATGQPLQGSTPAAQEVPSTPAAAPAPTQPAVPRKQPCHEADSAAQDTLSIPPPPPDSPMLPPTLGKLPSHIKVAAAAKVASKPVPAASQPPASKLQACPGGEAAAQEVPSTPAAAPAPALPSTPKKPASTAVPVAPRRPKLQPGDFYITLPKPPTAAAPREDACEVGEAGASTRQNGQSRLSPAGLADAADLSKAADPAVEGKSSLEQDSFVHGSTALGSHAAEQHLNSTAVPADAVSAHQAVPSQQPGEVSQQPATPVPEWRQQTSLRAGVGAAEAFSEEQSSSRARQAAAAARKEEAQELALEQAILEVHWRQAQEGMLPGEANAEEGYEGRASPAEPDHCNTVAAAVAAYTSGPSTGVCESAGWGASSAATPWSDWAAVEGPSGAEDHAGPAFAKHNPEAARLAGSGAYESEANNSARNGASGQWSPAELVAQAKAWADWAALQAQSGAQPYDQVYGYASPEAAAAEGSEAAKDATGAPGQWSPAELAEQAKAWADWASWQAQSGAQPYDQVYSYAFPAAAAQPECTQATQAPQAADAETVSIPVSMYRRYQELEWAEWRRQYEGWQRHVAEWQKQCVHWYSSYLAWYSQYGSAAVQ